MHYSNTIFGSPWFIVIIIIIVVVFLWQFAFSNKAEARRKLKQTPVKDFELINEGDVVKVTGKVDLQKYFITAPLSGRKVAFYHVIVTQHNKGKNNYSEQIINHVEKRPLILKNNETVIYVDTELVHHHIIMDEHYSSGTFKDADANLENFLSKFGKSSTGLFGFNRSLTYKEGVLEEGEQVAVVGKARWADANKLEIASKNNKILIIEAEDSGTVTLTDDSSIF